MKKCKNKLNVVFCSILLLLLSCGQNQMTPLMELIEIGQEMEKHSIIKYSYEINGQTSYSGKSRTEKGTIYFLENKSDTTIGTKFRIQLKNYDCIYDGNFVYTLVKMDSAAIKTPLNDYRDGHCTTYPALELSYRAINLFLTDPHIENEIDFLTKTDTLINSELCTKYSFVANERFLSTHKNYSKNDVKIDLIIQRANSLPIYYSQTKKFESGNQIYTNFSEVVFSKYSYEDNYPTSFFESESIPSYYDWTKLKFMNKTLPINTPAPLWTLPSIDGDSISLNSLKGQYVLLDFWFIGCGACIQSIPMLNELQNKFSNDRLSVIGVNCLSDDLSKINDYCANQGMNYLNAWMGDRISQSYNINAAPIYYLINPDGNIVYTQFGHNKQLLKIVESIINENTP